MKNQEAINAWLGGAMLQVGEYRSSEAERITWRDKESGAQLTAPILRHVVEFGAKSAIISERVDRASFKPEDYKPAFEKGQAVVVHVRSCIVERGVLKLDGTLEALEP